MFDSWRFHAFFTTSTLDTVTADKTHRGHAIIEQVHADLKHAALAHLPSGKFCANAAWLVCAAIAFNLTLHLPQHWPWKRDGRPSSSKRADHPPRHPTNHPAGDAEPNDQEHPGTDARQTATPIHPNQPHKQHSPTLKAIRWIEA